MISFQAIQDHSIIDKTVTLSNKLVQHLIITVPRRFKRLGVGCVITPFCEITRVHATFFAALWCHSGRPALHHRQRPRQDGRRRPGHPGRPQRGATARVGRVTRYIRVARM